MPDFLTLPSQSGYDPTTRPGLFGRQPGYVPYEPPNPDEEMFGRDTIYKERLAEQQKKAQENARLQRQAALDQHLRQYEDDPLAKLFGEAEFDRLEEDTARKASQKRLDDIQAEYDDPVEKILAVGRAMKLQGQQPVRQRQAEAEAIEQMRAADADQRAIEQTLPKNAFIREAAVGSAAASQTMASRLARMLGQGEAADELNRQVNTLNQGAAQARDKDWSPYLSRQFGGAVQSLIGTASTPGGPMLKIGGAAFDAGNQALTTAEDAGLTGTARLRYAGTQALLEGGVAAVFQKMGLGGAESRMAGQAVAAQTWKQLAKNLGKDALQEVPEEVMTAVLQDVSSKLEGVTPDAGFGDMVSNATDAAVQALLMSGLTNTPNAARLFIQRPSRENYKALPPEMKLPGKPENYVPPGDQRKAMAEQMRQGPAVQPSEPSATTGVTPEEQAAIDEENRLTAMKSPGAQPDFVPPPDPDAKPRGEVIQNQGQNAPVPPVSPRSETAVPSETKAPAIDFSQLTEEEVHQWLTELQGGPATEPQNPVQGGSHELQDEEKQRREGQQGLLTPDEPRSMNMARQQSQQWLRTNPEPTPPSPRYDGRALQSLAPSDPGSSPGAAVEAQGPVDQKAFQGTRKAGGFSGAASAGLGTQFATDSNEYASQYGDVTEVPVQFSNPYYMPLGEFRKYDRGPEASVKRSQQRAQELVASGHDGIVVTHHDGVREFITLPQRTNSAIAAMDEAGPEQREPSNPGVDAPATAVTDEQALKDSALPDENTPQDKVQELARIASERGWSVKTMKEKAIEAGVAPGAVRMAAAKMAQERQRAGTQQSPTPTVEEMRSNQQANPSVQELVDQLEAEANRLGLKFSTHTADTGSRYFSAGVPNPDGNWNDQIKVRVGDHGARFGSLRDVQLTTLQSPVDLQAGLEKAIQKLRNLQPATPAVSLPAGPSQGREVQQPDSSPTLLGEVSESAASPAPASGIEKARSAKREKDYAAAREQLAPQVAEGWTTGTAEVDDAPARKRMEKEWDRLRNEWDSISPDTPNGKRLKELKEQLKNPVTKPIYFMAHPNGRNRKSLTKTQYEALTQGSQADTPSQPTGPDTSSPTATAPQGDEQGPVVDTPTLEPWQMDRRAYNKSRQGTPVEKTSGMGRAESITADHRAEVRKAFAQGLDVPWLALEPYLDDFKREGQGQRLAERVQSDVEQGRDVPEAALKRYPPKPSKPAAKAPWQDRLDQIKRENGDALVLFRMGDFYEMFGDDAKKAAATLGLTLTTRDKSSDNPIPMAGFPYHALEGYLHKLVKSGHRVAVAEDPTGKKDAKRNITVQEPAKTPEVAAPVAALPTVSESQPTSPGAKHHIAIYGDKEVPVVSDKKREFMVAAQRVRDNLGTGEVGYVKTPDGKTFKITTDSKLAKPVDSVPEQTSPPSVAAKPETVVEKSASDVSAVSIQKGQRQKGLAGLEDVAAETESKESLALDNVANRNFLTGFGGREFADNHQTALRRLPGKIKARLAETGEVSEEEIQSWLLQDLPNHLRHKSREYDDWTKEVTIDAMNAASNGPTLTVTVPSGRKKAMQTWNVGDRVREGDEVGTITGIAKEVVDGSIVTFPEVQFDGDKNPTQTSFSDISWVDPEEEDLTNRLDRRQELEDNWSDGNPADNNRENVNAELTERVKTYFSPVDYENAGLEGKTGIDLLDSASTFAGDNKRLKLTNLSRELKALEDWYYDALPNEEIPAAATVEPAKSKMPEESESTKAESEAPKTDPKAFDPATTSIKPKTITVDENSNIILSKVPESLASHLATRLKEWWNEGRSYYKMNDDQQRLVDRLNEQAPLREPDVDVGDLDERYSEANSVWNWASSDKYQTKNAYDVYVGNEKSNVADKLGVPKQSRAKKWDSLWRQAEASAKETVEAKRLFREMKDADAAEAAAMKVRDETRREREKRTAAALRRQLGAVPSGTVLISGTNSNLAIRVGAWNEQHGWYDAETGATTLDGRFVSQGTTRLSPWQLHAGYVTAQQDADLNELREQVVKAKDLAKEKRKQIGERAAAERRAAIRQQNWTADTVKVTPAGMTPKGTKLYHVNVGDVVAVSDGHWMVHPGVMPKELVKRTETIGFMNSKDNPVDMKETAKAIAKGAVPLRFLGREIDGEGGGIAYLTDGKNVVGVDQEYYSYFADRGFEFRANKTTMLKNGEALKHGSRPSDAVAMFKDGAAVGMLMPRGDDVTLLSDFLGSLTPEQKSAARGPEASAPTLKEKAAKATQEMKDAAQAFKKSIGGTTPNIGSFSPEALQAFTKLTVKAINAGALNFADYVATLSAELGDMAESLRPLMAQMWPKIAARQGLDPSTEEAPKPEKVEASGPTLFGDQGPPVEPPADNAETPDDAGGVPNPTATKHADSDATREAMGMPPRKIHDPEGHSFEDLGEKARKAPSQEIDELIAELTDNPRTLDGRGYENALLLRRATELNNQYKKAVREKQEARDAGDSVKVVERDKAKQIAIEQRRMLADILDELGSRAGSELNARKMMMNDDYSVAHMEMEYADEHDGESPSDAQVEEWAKWEQQVKDLQEQVTQERAGREAAEQALALEKAHNAAIDRAEVDKKAKEKSSVIQKGIERGRKHLEDGFKLLGQMRGKVYSIEGAAVDLTKALTEIVRGYAEIGVFSFADAMKRFAQRVGTEAESMRSDFKQAWDAHFAENGIGELQDRIDPENPQSIGAIAKRLHQFVIERDNLGKSAEDRDRAVAGVHELLGEAMDDLTLEQTARILSGKDEPTRKLSEEEIRTEHRAQLQILEDIQSWKNNERPNAIQERRPDSDEQRKLRRIRAEAKKNAKVPDVRDPAQQLQSALDSAKTSTKNRIADLNEAIKTGQRIMASKTVLIPDAELVGLRAERDALQAAYDEAFGKKEMSDEQRAAMLEKALDRQIAQLETDIPKGILYPPAMQPKLPITNPAIAAKKAQRDALVARRDELRLLSPETAQRELEAREKALTTQWEKLKAEKEAGKLWNDKEHKAKPTNERIAALEEAIGLTLSERDYDRKNTPEYQAREMAYYERVLAGRVQFWQSRINEGDFAPKAPKEPRRLTESQMTLQHELEKAKDKFANEQEKWRIENRTATQKVKDFSGHAWDFWRDIKSTGELSPFGRQGLMYVAGHWLRAGKAIAESIGTAFATDPEHALSRINQKILDRPNAKAGLYKDVPFATKLNDRTSQQEVMIGEWAKRIPLFGSMVKRFGTAGEAFLNIARADMMDSMLATLGVEPNRVSKDEAKFLANAAGVLTGRGNLDPGTAKVLNRVLYSSLFTMSRIETVIGRPLWKQGGSARARMAIAKEYVRSAVGLYLMDMALKTALMALPGDDEEDEVTIETNTTSTDFGKLKAGRTRIDTMGGLQQTLVLLERLRQGQKTKSGVVEILGSTFGGDDENDLLSKFARSRLHPTLAMVWDRWTGENAVGEKTRPLTDYDPRTSAGLKNIALENGPMAYGDMLAAADELGYPRGLLAATAAFFGSGLSTYGNTKAEDQRFLTLKATGTLTTEDKVKATKGAMQGYTAAEFVKQGVPKAQQALKNARTPEQKRLAEKALRDAQTATESALAADVTIQSARKELLKIKSWDEKVKLYSQAYKERNGSIASPAFIEGVKRLPHANGPRKISPALRSELLQALNEKYPKRFNKDRTINQEWRKLKLAIEAM